MAEKHIICFFICFFLTIGLGEGLKRDGPKWDIMLPYSYKEPCVSILATDLAPYQRMLLSMPIFLLQLMLYKCIYLSEIGTSSMRSQDTKELLKMIGNPLFPSISASISCLISIVETDDNEEVLKLIEMINNLSVTKKYMLLIMSTFDSTMFSNLTINFQVMVHHSNTG